MSEVSPRACVKAKTRCTRANTADFISACLQL